MTTTHRVSIPEFDPAVDSLSIEKDGTTYTFVADFTLLQRITEENLLFNEEQQAKPEDVVRVLHMGLTARHPELTENDIKGWFPTLRAFVTTAQALQQYIEDVVGSAEEGADGQGEGEAGSNSGRGRGTTSKSRRRK